MLRIHFLQHWFNLSDLAASEEALYNSASLRRFASIDLGREAVPDATSLVRLRHLPEQRSYGRAHVSRSGPGAAREGHAAQDRHHRRCDDGAAPSSIRNADKQRDPEMHQTKKGKQWYFGMKLHIGVNSQSGLAHSAVVTSANMHASTAAAVAARPGEVHVWRQCLCVSKDTDSIRAPGQYLSGTPSVNAQVRS